MNVRRSNRTPPRTPVAAVIIVLAAYRRRSEFTRRMLAAGFKPWWAL